MDTKLVDKIYVDRSLYENDINAFFDIYFIESIKPLLKKQRWIEMDKHFIYDAQVNGCWLGLGRKVALKKFSNGENLNTASAAMIKHHKNESLRFPTKDELLQLTRLDSAPFPLSGKRRPAIRCYILYQVQNRVQTFDTDYGYLKDVTEKGTALPLLKIKAKKAKAIFFSWLQLGLTPIALKDDDDYRQLMNAAHSLVIVNQTIKLNDTAKKIKVPTTLVEDILLGEDHIRADLKPYHQKMLEDTNQGHWSLWDSQQDSEGKIKVHLAQKLVARNPACDIIDGVVGIDFGTKSTVVACQKESVDISPMRVGTGNLGSSIEAHHYENPTIIEFNNLQRFICAYQQRAGRPFTQWRDITISHTANNALLNSKSKFFNAFLFELKQWAGNKNKKLKVVDQQGFVLDLPPFLQLTDDDINPIEIYAYYLGLYINNMHNGIFLNYVLSFPVTYELAIRNKILDSFHQGIKKSLPQALHEQQEYLDKLQVIQGASEPAAYAIVALEAYEFDPCDDEVVFYSVFDFGGGTTDFDFGVFREAQGGKERRYDYVIEHFGAGGDKYLGGENLLDLLAFEVFKKNKTILLEKNLQFVLPPECKAFLGGEMLLSNSREAHMNMTNLVETLRPLWENHSEKLADFEQGSLGVNLIDANAKELTNVELDIGKDELLNILQQRIKRGVDNFFERLRLTMSKYGERLQKDSRINIFLAGNASKSTIVQPLFDERIAEETKKITHASNTDANADIYKIFPPLASDDDMEKPTGKTGVAFGLIRSRKGGKILVVDQNIEQDEVDFSFYLGENRKKKFKTLMKRDTPYHQWVEFIDAGLDTFELFYSSAPIVSNNHTPINDQSIRKKILSIDVVDESAMVYIRFIAPTQIEYVVAMPDGINNETYLGTTKKIDLGL